MATPIQEETRLTALREAEPEAAAVLDSLLPALGRMSNPELRRLVEANTTVAKAAGMAGIPVPTLLRQLRGVTGQAPTPVQEEGSPAWLDEARVETVIDAAAMLQTGEHPIGKVRQAAAALSPGGLVRMIVPFRPAPLLDTMARAGYAVFCRESAGSFEVFIGRV